METGLPHGDAGEDDDDIMDNVSNVVDVAVTSMTTPIRRRQTACRLEDAGTGGAAPRVTECLLQIGDGQGSTHDLSEYELADSQSELDLFPQIPIVGSETAMAALAPRPRPEASVSQSHTSPEGFLDDSLYQPHGHRPPPPPDRDDSRVCILRSKSGSHPNGLTRSLVEGSDSKTDLLTKALLMGDRSKSHPNGLTRIVIDKSGSLPNGVTRALVTRSISQPSGLTKQTAAPVDTVTKEHSPRNGYVCNFLEMQESSQSIDGLLEESVSQLNRITEDLLGDTVL